MAFNFTNNVKKAFSSICITAFVISLLLQISNSFANNKNWGYNLTFHLDSIPKPKTSIQPASKKLKTPFKAELLVNDTIKPKPIATDTSSSTLKKINKTAPKTDSTLLVNTIDTLGISKDSLDAPVQYAAQDSGVFTISTQQFLLYGKSEVKQKQMQLTAGVINYNGGTQSILAYGNTDTSNSIQSRPKMKEAENETISDTIAFNLKSQKGRSVNTYYTEGEIYVYAQTLKKIDSNSFYGFKGRFTTCNLDHPHFAFRTKKLKMITNKLAISGPAFPEFEGVPLPIGLPFGIFPMNRGRHSGLLAPQFTTTEDFGLGLEGLGWYKVVNDNVDVTVRTNIYSYGGWTLNVAPKYIKRYRYSGSMNITFQNVKSLNRSTFFKDEFNVSRSFQVNWSHNRDNRARPGTTFGASVNFGSTKFNQTVINNPAINFNNRLNSTINYSKDFRGKANLTLNASHDQNNVSKLINVQLPNIAFNVVTFYPFEKKDKVGEAKWYENIGLGYSGSVTNQISFYDTAFSFKQLLDTATWSATHNIPISLSLPALGPITIAPGVTYQERWYGKRIERSWNGKKIDTVFRRGFFTAREMNFGLTASTRIFGTVNFKGKGIKAIRHEIRPQIGISYKPDFAASYHSTLQVDSTKRTVRVSAYEGIAPFSFSEGAFGGITFGIDNVLEMKVKDKTDTSASATKKIKLIDGFGFNGSYNLVADSFALSPINFNFRTTILEKINITASANLDPYRYTDSGRRTKNYAWQAGKFNLGRITNGQIAISTQIQSKPRDESKQANKANTPADPFLTPEEQQRQMQFVQANPAEFTDFNIPWSVSLNYSLSFNSVQKPDYSGFTTQTFSSIGFTGDFSLTPKWKMGANGFYDVTTKSLQQLSLFISREMHCWQLSINVTPVNLFRSFSISISPKSGILRDLRINRNRTFSGL